MNNLLENLLITILFAFQLIAHRIKRNWCYKIFALSCMPSELVTFHYSLWPIFAPERETCFTIQSSFHVDTTKFNHYTLFGVLLSKQPKKCFYLLFSFLLNMLVYAPHDLCYEERGKKVDQSWKMFEIMALCMKKSSYFCYDESHLKIYIIRPKKKRSLNKRKKSIALSHKHGNNTHISNIYLLCSEKRYGEKDPNWIYESREPTASDWNALILMWDFALTQSQHTSVWRPCIVGNPLLSK